MNGRCFTKVQGNIIDADIYVQNNIHEYDAFIYGFQQNKNLSAETTMVLKPTIAMKLLFYLRSKEIQNSFDMSNLQFSLDKKTQMNSDMSVVSNIAFSLDKNIRIESDNTILYKLEFIINKYIRASETRMIIGIGTLDTGKMISDIEDLYISDIENLTINELSKKIDSVYGLKIALRKNAYISDIENLYISDIENLTIDELCFIRIY